MNRFIVTATITLLLAVVSLVGCRQQVAAPIANVMVATTDKLPDNADDVVWERASEYTAKLILQDLVEPRLLKASTGDVRVRALTDGQSLAVRLTWLDDSEDNLPGASRFCDACAIQIPATTEPTVPAPQMGEVGRPVEIAYWNAAWQAVVDGRGDTIQDLYPRTAVDYYPFKSRPLEETPDAQRAMEARYAPARALHNHMAGPRTNPVQDLLAEGPGTLTPAQKSSSEGRGKRTADGWTVVIKRPLPAGVTASVGTQVAFAVWEGGQSEVASRKMRTGWVPLMLQAQP
jgi:hypothetical protein